MPLARITEYYPTTTADGRSSIVCREATAPRDLASMILLWCYCCFAVVQVILAVTAVSIAGLHLRPHPRMCLLEHQEPTAAEQKEDACHFTFVACGLTLPITAGVVVLELLPNRLVSHGARNLVPLLLWILGCIVWGVQAAQLQHHVAAGAGQGSHNPAVAQWRDTTLAAQLQHHVAAGAGQGSQDPTVAQWRDTTLGLSWANFGLFLTAALVKLFHPGLSSCIDSSSICLGRACPEGCLPACDACCCLDVLKAKVPREVLRQGRVEVRFISWNQEAVAAAPAAAVQGMTRMDM
ncbi:hypothetical protein OEZ86_010044 [Tetradesmus obliquus]|nr:hypothetical protein OEZ86_010044 [Tetradesmus obliquus]